ncbi:hypothetical protein [Caudoviricetes sp.]|nr:hypothetical protein [Caudoviricetes sp.]
MDTGHFFAARLIRLNCPDNARPCDGYRVE